MSDILSTRRPRISDDAAYILPMGAFLALTFVGATWPDWYVSSYIAKTILAAGLLIGLRNHYTPISTKWLWLGVIVGVLGIVQWVAMQAWLEQHFAWFRRSGDAFNPLDHFKNKAALYSFLFVRIADATLIVPFMEELFWRDYLWRQVIAPNDFKLAKVGEWDWQAFVFVMLVFAVPHGNWWPTAIVWAAMIGVLLVVTQSLGACIVAHAVTNFLLAVYVLRYHQWSLW